MTGSRIDTASDAEISSLYDQLSSLFDELRNEHFDSLPTVSVYIGIPDDAEEELNGLTRWRGPYCTIYLSEWVFDTPAASESVRWTFIRKILLHEMTHVLVGRSAAVADHGEEFAKACSSIGNRRGWPKALPHNPNGRCEFMCEPDCAAIWPDVDLLVTDRGRWRARRLKANLTASEAAQDPTQPDTTARFRDQDRLIP